MVNTLCKTCGEPQGITHSVAAYWTASKQDSELPNLIVARTTVLDVYSVLHHGANREEGSTGAAHVPSHTLQLESSHSLHGEVLSLTCLASRRAGHRDSIVLTFDAGQVCVLGWDPCNLCPVATSLHYFAPEQLPTRGRTLFALPPVSRMEPSGRAAAILLCQTVLAVLPAVSPGVKHGVTAKHSTATVGNSFVIDLTQHGVRSARDFVFLHDADAVCLVLCDTDYTWAGSLHQRKDTCELKALSVRAQRKQQPVLWTSKRLPADSFAVVAAPCGGALVLSPSLIVFQNKSARVALCTNTTVIPGVIPDAPNFELYDDPAQKQQLAVEMAERYATNVPPVTVPEAAGRAQQSEVQADLAHCKVAFLTPAAAVVALASGQLLQLSLTLEGAGRVSKLAMRDPGSMAASPSTLAVLSSSLLFLGSWLGHSNLVSYELVKAQDAPPTTDPQPSLTDDVVDRMRASEEADGSGGLGEPSTAAEGEQIGADGQVREGVGTEGAGEPAIAADAAPETDGATQVDVAATSAPEASVGGLDSLLVQMQSPDEPASPAIELFEEPRTSDAAALSEATAALKRPLASLLGSDVLEVPTPKRVRSGSIASTVAGSGVLPGLPFAGLTSGASGVPGLPGSAVPGLGRLGSPGKDATMQEPVLDDDATLQDDHDDLEEALYHSPAQDEFAAAGHGAGDLVAFHGEDRLPQLGPIASFALGANTTVGYAKGTEEPILRGGHQLLTCVGQGRVGALAVLTGGLVPLQDVTTDLTGLGRCTGMWGLEHGPEANTALPVHEFMVLSFESSTYVYKFGADDVPVPLHDYDSCQFATDCQTVYAASMFEGLGIVQVCATCVNVLAGVDLMSTWHLHDVVDPGHKGASIVAAMHAQQYLLLRLSGGGAILLAQSGEGAEMEEVAGSAALLRPAAGIEAIGACCLYEDTTGWLQSVQLDASRGEAPQAGPAMYVLLCRHHSALEVYSMPTFARIAVFPALEQGASVVHASATPADPSPHVPEECQVAEVRMDSWAPLQKAAQPLGPVPAAHTLHSPQPLLVVRTRDERLYVYRVQTYSPRDSNSGGVPPVCLRRQPLDWSRRSPASSGSEACGNAYAKLLSFQGLGVKHGGGGGGAAGAGNPDAHALYQGVFLTGHQPVWLLAQRGTYRTHFMDNREVTAGVSGQVAVPLAGMATWNRPSSPHNFVVAAGGANACELRFCRMPPNLRLTMPNPTQYKGLAIFDKAKQRSEGVTPHNATWHPPSRLFVVATSRRAVFVPHMPPPEDTVQDPHAAFAYKLAEEVARVQKGETRFQLRGVSPSNLATACEYKFKPLEAVLSLETVRIHVPATSEAAPTTEVFVAAGVGTLVTEDWSSQGAVHLFRLVKERVQGFDGQFADRWTLQEAHRREFAGPVTAVATCSGNLVVAFGHNVEMYKWTGKGLTLISSPLAGSTRLPRSLAIMKTRQDSYMLVGNAATGLAFVQIEDRGTLTLRSRDFGRLDVVSADFLLHGQTPAFLQADDAGNLLVFKYDRSGNVRALPVGAFHLGHKVTALHRVKLHTTTGRINYGALIAARSGALAWVQPLAEPHPTLSVLASTMSTSIPHTAGLNPCTFRSMEPTGHRGAGDRAYGLPAPSDGMLNGDLLWAFVGMSRAEQDRVARKAGVKVAEVLTALHQAVCAAAVF